MDIVNEEFINELEKNYEYGRTHIKELWNILIENFSFIENDEVGAFCLEQIIDYRSSKKTIGYDKLYFNKVKLPLYLCDKYVSLDSDIQKIVKEIYSPFFDKMEKNYLNDESEKDAYRFVYKKNHEKNYYV